MALLLPDDVPAMSGNDWAGIIVLGAVFAIGFAVGLRQSDNNENPKRVPRQDCPSCGARATMKPRVIVVDSRDELWWTCEECNASDHHSKDWRKSHLVKP